MQGMQVQSLVGETKIPYYLLVWPKKKNFFNSIHIFLKIEPPYNPAVPFLDIFQGKKKKNSNSERYLHPYVQCSIIYNSQNTEAT